MFYRRSIVLMVAVMLSGPRLATGQDGVHTFTILPNGTAWVDTDGFAGIQGRAWAQNCAYNPYGGGSAIESFDYTDFQVNSGPILIAEGADSIATDCAAASANTMATGMALPHEITGSTIATAHAGPWGSAEVEIAEALLNFASTYEILAPPTPLAGNEVLVLVGNFSAGSTDSGFGNFGASAGGPGFGVTVGQAGAFGSTTFVSFPGGGAINTQTHNLNFAGSESLNGSFSVIVAPGQQITVTGGGANAILQVEDGNGSGQSTFLVEFEVRRFNLTSGQRVSYNTGL